MADTLKTVRHKFITSEKEHEFVRAPIGWDELDITVSRGKETNSNTLTISQNQEFTGNERQFLINEFLENGAAATVKHTREQYIRNNWESIYEDYADLSTLKYSKLKATCDFRDNDFDKKFNDNKKEKFELDRTTDLAGNVIPALETVQYRHRSRKILERTFLKTPENHSDTGTTSGGSSFMLTPKVEIEYSSDPNAQQVLDGFHTLGSDVSVANVFMFNSSKAKTYKLTINSSIQSLTGVSDSQWVIERYNNGADLDFVERINIGSANGSASTVTLTDEEIEIDVQEGESLAFGLKVDFTLSAGWDIRDTSIYIENDLIFQPKDVNNYFYKAVKIKDAFIRWFEILDPDIVFKSDFLDTNWPNLLFTGGESIRHVKYLNASTGEEEDAPICTTSFNELYEAVFKQEPCGYGIQFEDGELCFRLEKIEYFFDNEEAVFLGALDDVEITVDKDHTYTSVEIGNKKSGEIEGVYGLQAAHTVNTYQLPLEDGDNAYKALTDVIDDPTEIEDCFRVQYPENPDRDTRYDKLNFMFDAVPYEQFGITYYVARNWDEDFSLVDGVYSPETVYNVRLSPINCLLRHGFNFKQEYTKSKYDGKSIEYSSTNGNVSMRSQLTGGTIRQENSNILLSDLGDPLFTNEIITGKGQINYDLFKSITGGNPKKNHYKTFTWINENGDEETAFCKEVSISESMDVELYQKA